MKDKVEGIFMLVVFRLHIFLQKSIINTMSCPSLGWLVMKSHAIYVVNSIKLVFQISLVFVSTEFFYSL